MLAELLELAPAGVEETEAGDGVIEYALYGAPGELPALPRLEAAAGQSLVEVTTEEVEDGWDTRWREFHQPVVIGDTLMVRPPWVAPSHSTHDLVIDPGQAFGTGTHPTTRLCLELLLDVPEHIGSFVDLGCGSGVLAVLAAKLGYAPVLALDNDPAAIQSARENVRLNDADIVEIRRNDLRMDPLVTARTVAANLLAPLLCTLAGRLSDAPELPNRLIVSGLLEDERQEIGEAFAIHGLMELDRRTMGGWTALLLEPAP